MKRIIVNILAVFGLIFIFIILSVVYIFVADPFNLKPIFSPITVIDTFSPERDEVVKEDKLPNESNVVKENTMPDRVEFTISAEQRQALINLGVSPDSIPTSLSLEQEQCFIDVLGQARVDEIKSGDIPGPIEFIRAQACI